MPWPRGKASAAGTAGSLLGTLPWMMALPDLP
jgi:hypothetical protein